MRRGADYAAAEADVLAARTALAGSREPRLEMRSLRLLGGDITVARRRPLAEVVAHNEAGLGLAAELGDAVAEAMFRSRMAVLECTRLRLGDGPRPGDHRRDAGPGDPVARGDGALPRRAQGRARLLR